jgi:hypothetical protein
MAGYLIQAADVRLLDTLEVVLGALVNADRKVGSRPPAALTEVTGSRPAR